MLSIFVVSLFLLQLCFCEDKKQPNVIFFLTDDWGFNDVGYNDNTDTLTPFIDLLAKTESLIISQHYVQPLCTPSRAALLSGRYPMRYGLHDGTISLASPFALTRNEYLLSSEFQNQAYSTHIVGKWHLGHLTWDYTPTERGFDTFEGFYGGAVGYWDLTSKMGDLTGYDFRKDTEPWLPDTSYSMYAYRDRVLDILDDITHEAQVNWESDKPFFLYVGWQGSHSPSDAPESYTKIYESAEDDPEPKEAERIAFQAQTTLTDELFESIVQSLKSLDLWDNTLLIFASDNGAEQGSGDNSPLRGGKSTLWEGGVRVPAFVTGGVLPPEQRGKTMSEYAMHITDWYPTVLAATGLDTNSPNKLDGKNMWPVITGNEENEYSESELEEIGSKREILINVDNNDCENQVCGSLIYGGKWKLLISSNEFADNTNTQGFASCFWERTFQSSTDDALGCSGIPSSVDVETCACQNKVCLFDLENDPCEYFDVSEEEEEITRTLYKKLVLYYNEQSELLYDEFENVDDDIIDPDNTGGFWEPFYDSNEYTMETLDFEKLLKKYYSYSPAISPGTRESEHEHAHDRGLSPLFDFGFEFFNNHKILLIAMAFVIVFGGLVACFFGNYLKRYCTEVRGKESVILGEFMKEGREISQLSENSPLIMDNNVVL